MKIKQINKLSLTFLIFFSYIIIIQLLLQIPKINYIFSPYILQSKTGILIWSLAWVLIFLESGCIPGPYLPIIIFCANTSMSNNILLFTLFSTSAVFLGRILAYFLGQYTVGKLIKWSAGNNSIYENWCKKFQSKYGKLIYAFTVLAPGFPDFILALIAGSIKMNFLFYLFINLLCKGFENYLIIAFNFLIIEFNKFIYIYVIIIIILLFIYIITLIKIFGEKI